MSPWQNWCVIVYFLFCRQVRVQSWDDIPGSFWSRQPLYDKCCRSEQQSFESDDRLRFVEKRRSGICVGFWGRWMLGLQSLLSPRSFGKWRISQSGQWFGAFEVSYDETVSIPIQVLWAHFDSWHHTRRCAHLEGKHSSIVHICATEYWQLVMTCTYAKLSQIISRQAFFPGAHCNKILAVSYDLYIH